ncbi:MAG: hypothetical protein R6U62_05245 [Bacteroidales bacterium]
MKPADTIARLFSIVLHPLLIPTLGIFILFQLSTYLSFSVTAEARRFILLVIFINTAIIPVLSVLILKQARFIKDLTLDERQERILPLLIATVMLFFTFYLLRQLTLPSLIYYYVTGAAMLVLSSLVITFYWKISVHMISLGGLTGFLIVVSLLLRADISHLIIAAFLVSGITAASRIHLQSHTPAQVYTGYLLGVFIMLMLFVYLRV